MVRIHVAFGGSYRGFGDDRWQCPDYVKVSGSPRLKLEIGENIRYAELVADAGIGFDGLPPETCPPDAPEVRWVSHPYRYPDALWEDLYFEYRVRLSDRDDDGILIPRDPFEFEGGAFLNRDDEPVEIKVATGSGGREEVVPRPWIHHRILGPGDFPGDRLRCGDQRELALDYGSLLAEEWEPGKPFGFRIEEGPIIEGGLRIGKPDFLEDQVLGPLRRTARRISERLGYSILDLDAPAGETAIRIAASDSIFESTFAWQSCEVGAPAWAVPGLAETLFARHFFDPAYGRVPSDDEAGPCPGYRSVRETQVVIHEVAHLLGMKHASGAWTSPDGTRTTSIGSDPNARGAFGVAMSFPLTVGLESGPTVMTQADIDNLGCMFPHPEFPPATWRPW